MGQEGGPSPPYTHALLPSASAGVHVLALGPRGPQLLRFTSAPRAPLLTLGSLLPTFTQVYTVVDEMFLAGEIRETSQTKVLKQLLMLQSLE